MLKRRTLSISPALRRIVHRNVFKTDLLALGEECAAQPVVVPGQPGGKQQPGLPPNEFDQPVSPYLIGVVDQSWEPARAP